MRKRPYFTSYSAPRCANHTVTASLLFPNMETTRAKRRFGATVAGVGCEKSVYAACSYS